MKLGKKAFLNRDPLCEDFTSWYFSDENVRPSGIFNIGFSRVVVSLHTPDLAISNADCAAGFIKKLQILSDELKAAATHVSGQLVSRRCWLNPDNVDAQHMTGYVAWGDNGLDFYVTVADCQRAWRMNIGYDRPHGQRTVRIHQRKLLVMIRHIDQAIKELKNVR